MKEQVVLFGKTDSLVGILTHPPEAERDGVLPAIIFLNAGFVHRVGPNRLYVTMAREFAAMGFVALRFDFAGIGDSPARTDSLSFLEGAVEETQAAMDYLQAVSGAEHFVLCGLCSGAKVSYRVACCDPRIVGAVLLNPREHLHDTTDHALNDQIKSSTLAYNYKRKALSSSFRKEVWVRTLRGKLNYGRLIQSIRSIRLRDLLGRRRNGTLGDAISADFHSLHERSVPLLHVYSEADKGLDYLHMLLGDGVQTWSDRGLMSVVVIPVTSHTFVPLWSQEQVLNIIRPWLQARFGGTSVSGEIGGALSPPVESC